MTHVSPLLKEKKLMGLKLGERCNKMTLPCHAENSECRVYKCRCKNGYVKKGDYECPVAPKVVVIGKYCRSSVNCPTEHAVYT